VLDCWKSPPEDTEQRHYSTSAQVLLKWSTFCCLKGRLTMLTKEVEAAVAGGLPPDFEPIKRFLWDQAFHSLPLCVPTNLWESLYNPTLANNITHPPAKVIQEIKTSYARTAHSLFFDYLVSSASLESAPYRWEETQQIMLLDRSTPFLLFDDEWGKALERIVYSRHPRTAANKDWNDILIKTLFSFWQPDRRMEIPSPLIYYINEQASVGALHNLFTSQTSKLWKAFLLTLHTLQSQSSLANENVVQQVMMALWRVASLGPRVRADLCRPVLEAVNNVGSSESPVAFSVVALMKSSVVCSLKDFTNPLLPTETAVNNAISRDFAYDRRLEAQIALLAEFLEGCNANFMPYEAVETVRGIIKIIPVPRAAVHESHQLRLANGLHWASNCDNGVELLEAIVSGQIFNLYVGLPDTDPVRFADPSPGRPHHAWLENPLARGKIKDTLTDYAAKPGSSTPLTRVQAILQKLDSLHDTTSE
jgi:hypothetical protein